MRPEHVIRSLCAVIAFAVAMGFLEAAVVVYLRMLFYPGGFSFPLAPMPQGILIVEMLREVATVIMLAAVGYIAGRTALSRFAFFAIAFGVWDIFYYVFLKAALGWPASLLTDDILFLLPFPWIGPVLAPVIVSLGLVGAGTWVLRRESIGRPVVLSPLRWLFIGLGGVLTLGSFLEDTGAALHHMQPESFDWLLFAAGMSVGMASFVAAARTKEAK